jgi:hypothetical protein
MPRLMPHGFVLATTISPASVNDTNYLQYCTVFSRHTKQKIKKVYAVQNMRAYRHSRLIEIGAIGNL